MQKEKHTSATLLLISSLALCFEDKSPMNKGIAALQLVVT